MANYATLKTAIQNVIKTNGNNEITGALLQQSLLSIINSLGAGYQFMGVAQTTTSPGTPDQNVFYIAGPGVYANFNNTTVQPDEYGIFRYNGSWTIEKVPGSGLALGVPTQTATTWTFSYKLQAGKTYYVKAFNHNNGSLVVGYEGLGTLKVGKWVEITPTQSGNPSIYFGSGSAGATPIVVFSENNGAVTDSIGQDNRMTSLSEAISEIQEDLGEILQTIAAISVQIEGINELNKYFFVFDVRKKIHETQGTASTSRDNILNEVNIPAGTVLKIKLNGTSGVLSKVQLINQNYTSLYNRAYTDGTIITITLASALTKMGLYVEAATAIGTGDIEVLVCTDYQATIGGHIEALEQNVSQQEADIDALQDFAQTGFLYDNRVVIPVTQGTNLYSRNNLLNNVNIPGGTVLKIKLNGTSGIVSKVHLVDQNWAAVYNGTYTDGDVISYTVPSSLTQMGFYVEAANAIGTGDVTVQICSDYNDSLSGRIDEIASRVDTAIIITCKPDGTPGVDADFCGLTAIADAINSITDASPTKKYVIHIMGIFRFTDPLTVPMLAGGEYSIIAMKDYVDIMGDGREKSALILDIPANATFHSGKTYSDYQPVYFYGTGGKLSKLSIYGKNCRYGLHIETAPTGAENKEIEIEDCNIDYDGASDYGQSGGDAVGTGLTSGQKWTFRNCRLSGSAAFACHTPLRRFDIAPVVTFNNCIFAGVISLHTRQYENNCIFNFVDCLSTRIVPILRYLYYVASLSNSEGADYTRNLLSAVNFETLFDNTGFTTGASTPVLCGAALRVVSASNGATSVVSFDVSSSAFAAIIGNSSKAHYVSNLEHWSQNDAGYIYRNGGVGISGQAFGTLDVSENGAHTYNLGQRLGDCSSINKSLKINVDGVDYTVTFDKDYTNYTNSQVIAEINTVLGAAAVADVFSPGRMYYPYINGFTITTCLDANSIMAGMGVVFVNGGMRRAKNTDGYIDGICLDDTAEGQSGRVITKGYIFSQAMKTANYQNKYFCAKDNLTTAQPIPGTLAGISATDDGVFDINASPKLLQACIPQSNQMAWKII